MNISKSTGPGKIGRLLALGFVLHAGHLVAQQAPEVPGKSLELEKYTVTGSNIKMSTAEADKTALPIEFIPASKFLLTAGESVSDMLRNQPLISGNVTSQYNDEAQGGNSGVNLRGIGEKYTLVLVNGRRIGGEEQPNLGAIPAEAIESIEILKSGASSVFGSDAVAGVVNIKLKEYFEGLEVVTSYGNTTNRDASYKRVAATFGLGRDKLKLVGSVGWEDRNAIEKYDRSLTVSRDYRSLGGLDRRTTSTGVPQLITLSPGVTRIIDLTRFTVGQTGTTAADYIPYNPALYSYSNNEIGTAPGLERLSASWNISYELLDKRLEAFATGYWNNHKQVFKPKEARAQLTVPASNPYNPFGQQVTVAYLFGDRPPVEESWDIDVLQSTTGLRGTLGDFDYSVAFSRYDSMGHETWTGDLDRALTQAAANRTDATAFNPFGYYANSDAQLAGLIQTKHYDQHSKTDIYDAKLSGPLFTLPAGDLRFAAGAEKREVTFSVEPDLIWQTRITSIHSLLSPSGGDRDVRAYFGEVKVPVFHRETGFFHALEVSGASRYEKFSDFGSATVAQANFRLALLQEKVVVRGSWAEAFKAPTVNNLFAPQSFQTPGGYFDPVRNTVAVVQTILGGNPGLRPESADTYNFGVIFTPKLQKGPVFKADYWKVVINDVIFQPNGQDLLNGISPGGSITRDPVTLFPTLDLRLANGGVLTTAGIDVGASHTFKFSSTDKLSLDLNGTYLLKFENASGPAPIDYVGDYSGSFGPVPRVRAVLGAWWEHGDWETSLFLNYTGGLREQVPGLANPNRSIEETCSADLQLAYSFGTDSNRWWGLTRNLRVYVGVENIWDEALAFVASSNDGWNRSLGDFRGRYVYGGLRKKF